MYDGVLAPPLFGTVDGRNPKQPPGMYETLWMMGNLPFLNHQQFLNAPFQSSCCSLDSSAWVCCQMFHPDPVTKSYFWIYVSISLSVSIFNGFWSNMINTHFCWPNSWCRSGTCFIRFVCPLAQNLNEPFKKKKTLTFHWILVVY